MIEKMNTRHCEYVQLCKWKKFKCDTRCIFEPEPCSS